MPERLTPHEPDEAKEPPQKPLSNEGKASISGGPEATKPGDLNHPTEGMGEFYVYGDGQGGLVTPEMYEKHKSPENQIEREPYTYRAVPVDPAQTAAGPTDTPPPPAPLPDPKTAGDIASPTDTPAPTKPVGDVGRRSIGGQLTPEDEALLKSIGEERARLDAELKEDLKKFDERPRPPWYREPNQTDNT